MALHCDFVWYVIRHSVKKSNLNLGPFELSSIYFQDVAHESLRESLIKGDFRPGKF